MNVGVICRAGKIRKTIERAPADIDGKDFGYIIITDARPIFSTGADGIGRGNEGSVLIGGCQSGSALAEKVKSDNGGVCRACEERNRS